MYDKHKYVARIFDDDDEDDIRYYKKIYFACRRHFRCLSGSWCVWVAALLLFTRRSMAYRTVEHFWYIHRQIDIIFYMLLICYRFRFLFCLRWIKVSGLRWIVANCQCDGNITYSIIMYLYSIYFLFYFWNDVCSCANEWCVEADCKRKKMFKKRNV